MLRAKIESFSLCHISLLVWFLQDWACLWKIEQISCMTIEIQWDY